MIMTLWPSFESQKARELPVIPAPLMRIFIGAMVFQNVGGRLVVKQKGKVVSARPKDIGSEEFK